MLDVRLMLNPELNEEVTVRPDGHISTTVVRMSMPPAAPCRNWMRRCVQDYSKDLQNPRVSVVVRSFAPTRIYVGGEVNNPGEFITVGPTLTLSQAIARAGGPRSAVNESESSSFGAGRTIVPEFLSSATGP